MSENPERQRLIEHRSRKENWRKWGPYLSERAWGTVREDYSENGEAWNYFSHDMARSRAYRWNEDGIGGISDRFQYLCFAPTFWNEKDPILKERFFGLNSQEGNHGEDVKEYYFYLDSTPTHSYMKMLYKYPQEAYPYSQLLQENQRRNSDDPEYELLDTGIFQHQRYFDIEIAYAKVSSDDMFITITAKNCGQQAASLHILPTLWFRNTWDWGHLNGPMDDTALKPCIMLCKERLEFLEVRHSTAGHYYLYAENPIDWLFTENETNFQRLYGQTNTSPFVKDAFHRYLIEKESRAVNPLKKGTKATPHFYRLVDSQESWTVRLRLSSVLHVDPFDSFNATFLMRQKEADQFYLQVQNPKLDEDQKKIQRQAFANLLWGKQLYYYDIEQWVAGDPKYPLVSRKLDRNKD